MKEKEQVPNLFDITFIGEYVEIILKVFSSFQEENEHGISGGSVPTSVKGFLLETDDTYYYLGDEPNSISRAVKKNDVSYVEMSEPNNFMENMLDQMPIPDDQNRSN